MHISVTNDALWDTGLLHCGICETGILHASLSSIPYAWEPNMVTVFTVAVSELNGTRTSTEITMTTKTGMLYLDNETSVSDMAQPIAYCWRDNEEHRNMNASKLQRK